MEFPQIDVCCRPIVHKAWKFSMSSPFLPQPQNEYSFGQFPSFYLGCTLSYCGTISKSRDLESNVVEIARI